MQEQARPERIDRQRSSSGVRDAGIPCEKHISADRAYKRAQSPDGLNQICRLCCNFPIFKRGVTVCIFFDEK